MRATQIYCRDYNALTYARVIGPKYPDAGVMPTLFWNSMRAAFVSDPKSKVAPWAANCRPAGPAFREIRNSCSCFTSLPRMPTERFRVKAAVGAEDLAVRYAAAAGGRDMPCTCACWRRDCSSATRVLRSCDCRACNVTDAPPVALTVGAGAAAGVKVTGA